MTKLDGKLTKKETAKKAKVNSKIYNSWKKEAKEKGNLGDDKEKNKDNFQIFKGTKEYETLKEKLEGEEGIEGLC